MQADCSTTEGMRMAGMSEIEEGLRKRILELEHSVLWLRESNWTLQNELVNARANLLMAHKTNDALMAEIEAKK